MLGGRNGSYVNRGSILANCAACAVEALDLTALGELERPARRYCNRVSAAFLALANVVLLKRNLSACSAVASAGSVNCIRPTM
jgi:hypothetical protein